MTDEKCVVEGCDLEYDVVCSFSFYNVNSSESEDNPRQEWIDGAMKEDSECLWRHVTLQLCGYHFELDSQGLWIDSPMLPELLTAREPATKQPPPEQSEEDKKVTNVIHLDHNYSAAEVPQEPVSRLNVRQLVDTLGYLSLKNIQRKQLWVVKVETEKAEASITQAEQVITKMQEPKQIIEILPHHDSSQGSQDASASQSEVLHIMDDQTSVPDNFIYEIAEEQEIAMDEVSEVPAEAPEWTVNIVPDTSRPKYAFIKHCNTGKKKRHFTAEMDEITVQGDFENYYILPDADPSVGVEVTTSYEPENFIVEGYQHLVLQGERPRKRGKAPKEGPVDKRKKKKSVREQVKQIKASMGDADWSIETGYDQDESDDYDPKNKARVRRKNAKYLGI